MGTYLNPGNILFQEALNSKIYVDKTALIQYTNEFINTKDKYVCVSRPRRFGKSMALEMLAAYYGKGCDSRKMFQNLKVGQTETKQEEDAFLANLNNYDVLVIDIQGILGSTAYEPGLADELAKFRQRQLQMGASKLAEAKHPMLSAMQQRLIRDICETKDYAKYISAEETSLGNALLSIYKNTGNQFILLLDEWDSIFRNYEEDTLLQDKYIGFLRDLFKNAEMQPVFALVYITGILPIKRYGTQSALNNFKEYTMLEAAPLEEFVGFTEEETLSLYAQYGMDAEKAKEWYDGYQMEGVGHIYNPNSVVESITRKKYKNFWTATGTYISVKKSIERNFDGLKEDVITMLGNGRCRVDVGKFQNDMVTFYSKDDVLTFLIHLGYLGYDALRREVYIPNKEIRDEFVRAIEGKKWSHTFQAVSESEELLAATLRGEEEKVAFCIEKIHESNTALLTYNNENALSCMIQIAYYQAQDEYILIREMPSGKGFADVVFIPRKGVNKPAIVVELKWNKSVETALDQIRDKNYGEPFREYFGEVLLVAITYEKENKKHRCKIEKCRKETNMQKRN